MRIRIAQWNVWFQEPPKRVLRKLRDLDADIICLQEVSTTSNKYPGVNLPETLAHKLKYQFVLQEAHRWMQQGSLQRNLGNAILSRLPIVRHQHMMLVAGGGHD